MTTAMLSGCGWRGLNSFPLPGTQGGGPGSFVVQAQMPDVNNIQQNSRVRVGDINVGTVTKIERQGWHALVTMRLDGGVELPANSTVTIGQTSLFGSLHIELAPPAGIAPEGRLHDGSVIALPNAGAYPSTEQTLAAVSLLLNGGGVGNLQDVIQTFSTAFRGREQDLRSLIGQLDTFFTSINAQTSDIIDATDKLNRLVDRFAEQKPVVDKALTTIPDAIAVLRDERNAMADAVEKLGQFSALAADSVHQTKEALVKELKDIGPVLKSLADAGPALTRSLGMLATYPFPADTLENWFRGDYGNMTAIVDLTLSRLDAAYLTGTRFEGALTELELQWGRTIGQMPSPYTAGNPLIVPYHLDEGR
ncbi:virulence factor Mce family protein [Mycobacterium sp. CVI_P3]|uniref:Virulence factor Mce family protein n=1 Tax=Mycobacterium pinniadriaticum TaxID=2994102 RepID=A0ABT3SEX1_9MYCO|nr:virulence factor Mce family protein [Mycobacterium pinniadriaticum]MCX2931676.1 virulence factor Mce family protein [Mycobacterium pinniadriaticum]MCX2937932.1 virulence factor Mce family protein [Mycobacterium pinniadriaticum]